MIHDYIITCCGEERMGVCGEGWRGVCGEGWRGDELCSEANGEKAE